jgi:hypothetical protein
VFCIHGERKYPKVFPISFVLSTGQRSSVLMTMLNLLSIMSDSIDLCRVVVEISGERFAHPFEGIFIFRQREMNSKYGTQQMH